MTDAEIAQIDRQLAAVARNSPHAVREHHRNRAEQAEHLSGKCARYRCVHAQPSRRFPGKATTGYSVNVHRSTRRIAHRQVAIWRTSLFPDQLALERPWGIYCVSKNCICIRSGESDCSTRLATLEGASIEVEPFAAGDVATRILYLPWNFPDQRVVLKGGQSGPVLSVRSDGDRALIANPGGRRRLLIFANSFGAWIAPLLARHFNEVEILSRPTWPALFDGERVAEEKADVALIEIAERSLPELLQPARALERACSAW